MTKISFGDFIRLMSDDIRKNKSSIEVSFYLEDCSKYTDCWLGRQLNKETGEILYWYGLISDGSGAYDYKNLEEMISAKIFDGKSLEEIWDFVILNSINATDVEEMLELFLNRRVDSINDLKFHDFKGG